MTSSRLLGGLAMAFSIVPAIADVTVRIVDIPTEVLRYSPVFVTARIENTGSAPVLIPITNLTSNRYTIELGTTADALTELQPLASTGGGDLRWLKPGEAWFVSHDIGPWLHRVGEHVVRVGLTSTGECDYHATGAEAFPIDWVKKEPGLEIVRCWSGRSISDSIHVTVREPESSTDKSALEFVRSAAFPVTCCLNDRFQLRLQFGVASLLEKFPTSHYTFVAALYGANKCPDCLARLEVLQPTHPLRVYAKLQAALALLQSGQLSRVDDKYVADLRLPIGLKDYLEQERRESDRSKGAPVSPQALD